MPANVTVNYHVDIAPDKIVDALAGNHVFILPGKSTAALEIIGLRNAGSDGEVRKKSHVLIYSEFEWVRNSFLTSIV